MSDGNMLKINERKQVCNLCMYINSPRRHGLSNFLEWLVIPEENKLEELAPLKSLKCSAICNACNKAFVRYSDLTQHVKKYHKGEE
ncbi:unnamed protein product [Callosobruchus maculatus]|uniref:C2H2-type domain-containing protein n=1 Tax=Callosobruchus maculatus TaxID=64391 RepID=A0A653C0N7_CALMS|nr:unnamed protein product [Callosobruchus maculatus]